MTMGAPAARHRNSHNKAVFIIMDVFLFVIIIKSFNQLPPTNYASKVVERWAWVPPLEELMLVWVREAEEYL
jgi:hypothetical protein